MHSLSGQVAVVTGASRGIGAAVARCLASEGATVVINYRTSQAKAEAVAAEIEGGGQKAVTWRADVSHEPSVREMFEEVLRSFGRVDILVCNAGIVRDGLAAGMSVDAWQEVLGVNLTGAFLPIRAVLPHMIEQRRGSIITIASVHADSGGSGHCNYAASKAGLLALTRALAIELGPRGIRVNAVSPGLIVTDMTREVRDQAEDVLLKQIPLRRFGETMEVARAVAFLASSEASYITGTTLHVSGGLGL